MLDIQKIVDEEVLALQNFPKDAEVRRVFAETAGEIIEDVHKEGVEIDEAGVRRLTQKLAQYCLSLGYTRNEDGEHSIANFSAKAGTLRDAILQTPAVITNEDRIVKILYQHQQQSLCSAKAARARLYDSKDAPPVLFTAKDPDYTLVELTSPAHLMQEAAVMKHCMAGYNHDALRQAGLRAGGPGSERYLNYAIKIREEKCRIFSLRYRGQPLVSMEYNIRSEKIKQMVKKRDALVLRNDPFLPALGELLFRLKQTVPIRKISGFPKPKNAEHVLSGEMQSVRVGDIPPAEVFMAPDVIRLSPDGGGPYLSDYFMDKNFTIDVSDYDLTRLPKQVKATLVYTGKKFNAPQLERARVMKIEAEEVSLPRLEKVKKLTSAGAAPQLVLEIINRRLGVRRALPKPDLTLPGQQWDLPALREAKEISLPSCESFLAPQLENVGRITLWRAKNVALGKLKKVGELETPDSLRADFPDLEEAGTLLVSKAENVHLPVLQKAKKIDARAAKRFYAPELSAEAEVFAPLAKDYSGPPRRPMRENESRIISRTHRIRF